MTKLITKFVIFLLGIFIGLLLREFAAINDGLMPVIYENLLFVGLLVIFLLGLVFIVIIKD